MRRIEDEVRTFVVENFLFGEDDHLSETHSFLEKGIIDSTGVLELVGFIESRYSVAVLDHELVPANLDSIERVARFVRRKREVGAA